jgi:hypothetical protein
VTIENDNDVMKCDFKLRKDDTNKKTVISDPPPRFSTGFQFEKLTAPAYKENPIDITTLRNTVPQTDALEIGNMTRINLRISKKMKRQWNIPITGCDWMALFKGDIHSQSV